MPAHHPKSFLCLFLGGGDSSETSLTYRCIRPARDCRHCNLAVIVTIMRYKILA